MRAAATIALLVLAPVAVAAQQRADSVMPKPPGRTIVGVVTDSAGSPLDSAGVFIPALKRATAADASGRFRFDDVKPGEYQVAVRRLGFFPQRRTAIVTQDSGAAVSFALVPNLPTLAPVVSSARRGGLTGVIGDTAWVAIKDAEVWVSGTRRAVSDSVGSFFADLRPGRHFVRVKREGYASQLVSVSIPRDSGRRVTVFLKPAPPSENVREAIALFEMDMRLNRRSAANSTLFTREDILKGPWTDAQQVAQSAASTPVGPDCQVTIDGGPRTEFLWAIHASEIEAVEVYRPKIARATVTSIMGGGKPIGHTGSISAPVAGSGCSGNAVYVWLRK